MDAIAELQFTQGDDTTVYGEVDGCPVTMTLWGETPLSLLFAFFVGEAQYNHAERRAAIRSLAKQNQVDLALEHVFVWLTLLDLSGRSGSEIAEIPRQTIHELREAGFDFSSKCGVCGSDETSIAYVDEKAVRTCNRCANSRGESPEPADEPNPA